MLEVSAFFNPERARSTSNNDNNVNFSGEKKCNEAFRDIYFFYNTRKNFESNLVLVVVPVLESKALCFPIT